MEKRKKPIRSWGVVWNESIPRASAWYCLNCGWQCLVGGFNWYKYVIGFDSGPYGHPKIIIECPECFEKFWFHCQDFVDSLMRDCPNWPDE
jgi:hypothetical protein